MSEPAQELAVIEHEPRAALVQVAPQVQADELVRRLDVIADAMGKAMKQDVDYGVIPGTGSKPTLLKPGAEKLGALFQLDVQLENDKTWHDDGHLTVVSRAVVFHQPTGTRLGSGEGICTTREAKYAYRNADRVCPACSQPAIIKGKAEYGGGWLCFKKKGGCGAKFPDGATEIESQPTGKVPNENLADAYNTVDKMASKRARIDAVLAVTGASALFTQDIEDFAPSDGADGPVAATHPAAGTARDGAAAEEAPVPSPLITNPQRKRLWAIAQENLVAEERLREIVREVAGVESSQDIPKARYDAVIEAVQAEAVPFG